MTQSQRIDAIRRLNAARNAVLRLPAQKEAGAEDCIEDVLDHIRAIREIITAAHQTGGHSNDAVTLASASEIRA